MDKQEKEYLKHDAFVDEVTHGVDYVTKHKSQIGLYAGIAVAVLAIGFGWFWWSGKQAEERQAVLRAALETQQAAVGQGSNPDLKTFLTQAAKDAAALKEFGDIIGKYGSQDEGAVARYYSGIIYADQAKFAEAEKYWQATVDTGSKEYASLARFALAQLYAKQGKIPQAEAHLKYLADNPTTLVSKENAQIELAKVLAPTKPQEAQKILEPLRQITTRGSVSRWAITAYGETRPGPKP